MENASLKLQRHFLRDQSEHDSIISELQCRPKYGQLSVAGNAGVTLIHSDQPEPGKNFKSKESPLTLVWSLNAVTLAHRNQDTTANFALLTPEWS